MSASGLLIVGRLRKAHGIRGALVVQPLTDAPAVVYTAGRRLFLADADGNPDPHGLSLAVVDAQERPDGSLTVQFEGVHDRTAAERWRGRYLLAESDSLEPPAEGEVYIHELVGMQVALPSGEPLGEVTDVLELPQGLALEIRLGAREALLPFVDEFVTSIDRPGRQIIATPPAGLFE